MAECAAEATAIQASASHRIDKWLNKLANTTIAKGRRTNLRESLHEAIHLQRNLKPGIGRDFHIIGIRFEQYAGR